MKDLHTKYRPQTWEEVIGQKEVIDSLAEVVEGKRNRSFLLTGPSGCGKTTVARIIAKVEKAQVQEIDAASTSGVEAMRAITTAIQYAPLGKAKSRLVIVDECHSLSKQAWQSLLKSIEEPPPHVWWALCTTEGHKVPKTIKTRCAHYELKRVKDDDLFELLDGICQEEEAEVPEDVIDLCVSKADGSPRQALTYLATVADCEDRKAAAQVLADAGSAEGEVLELCRLLGKGTNWSKAMKVIGSLEGINPEGARRQVFAYFSKVAQGAKSDDRAAAALEVMEAFSTPYPDDSMGHVVLSLGELLLGGD